MEQYKRILLKEFDSRQKVITELTNLEAILNLPKGTELYISDIHGEFEAFDYIFVMDRSNYQHLIRLARNEHDLNKISFLSDALDKMTKAEIPDPYYGSEADFEKVYQLIDAACEKVADKLTTNS